MGLTLRKISLLIVGSLFAFVIFSSYVYMTMNSPVETEDKPTVHIFTPKRDLTVPFDLLVCTSQPNLKVTVYYDGEPLGSITTNSTNKVLFTITKPAAYEPNGFSAEIVKG